MTSLTASRMPTAGLERGPAPPSRRRSLRALLARMVDAACADTARRSLAGLPPHLRRDIGLGEIDVLDL